MKFQEAYVISLEESVKRRNKFFSYAKRAKIEVNWFPGIRGDQLHYKALQDENVLSDDFVLKMPGSLGCLMSHTAVWDAIRDSGSEYGIVFEDDAILPRNFSKKLEKLSHDDLPDDWDMLWLGWHKLDCSPLNSTWGIPNQKALNGFNSGHFGYIVKASSVNKMKALLYPYNNRGTKDGILRNRFDSFNALFLFKPIVTCPFFDFSSIRKMVDKPDARKDTKKRLKKLFKIRSKKKRSK